MLSGVNAVSYLVGHALRRSASFCGAVSRRSGRRIACQAALLPQAQRVQIQPALVIRRAHVGLHDVRRERHHAQRPGDGRPQAGKQFVRASHSNASADAGAGSARD